MLPVAASAVVAFAVVFAVAAAVGAVVVEVAVAAVEVAAAVIAVACCWVEEEPQWVELVVVVLHFHWANLTGQVPELVTLPSLEGQQVNSATLIFFHNVVLLIPPSLPALDEVHLCPKHISQDCIYYFSARKKN
jgi:Predicted helicases